MCNLGRFTCIVTLGSVLLASAFGQGLDVKPGVDRWPVKTTMLKKSRSKFVPLGELESLPAPISQQREARDSERIPRKVGPRKLKEGDFVRTTGWIHLVALERESGSERDGDYHIQIRTDSTWADSCLIVEAPYPDFVNDSSLKSSCSDVREFIREKLLKNKEPGTGGNIMTHAAYVTLKGQLFFDAPHFGEPPRGKKAMKSYTPWEIHPVVSMWFEKKPPNH